jgi:hypothetical protein
MAAVEVEGAILVVDDELIGSGPSLGRRSASSPSQYLGMKAST